MFTLNFGNCFVMVKTALIKVFTIGFLLNQIKIFEAKIILWSRTYFPSLALNYSSTLVSSAYNSPHEDTIISSLAGDRYTYSDTLVKTEQSENTAYEIQS